MKTTFTLRQSVYFNLLSLMVILSNTIYITLWADYELASPGRLEQKRDLTTCREVGETPRNFSCKNAAKSEFPMIHLNIFEIHIRLTHGFVKC